MKTLYRICTVMFSIIFCSLTFCPELSDATPLEVRLLPSPPTRTTLVAGAEPLTMTARVPLEGVRFEWTLDGPGRLEEETPNRKARYIPPERLNGESAAITVHVTVSNVQEQAEDQLELTLLNPSYKQQTSDLEKLQQEADEFFQRKFYTDPAIRNAFIVYQEVVQIDPDNQQARERIRQMAADYKQRGDEAFQQAQYEEAAKAYERYLKLADYLLTTLNQQEIQAERAAIQARIQNLASPEQTSQQPAMSPAPNLDVIQRPGVVYAVIVGANQYQDERIPTLPAAAQDAQAVYDTLTASQYGGIPQEQITLLTANEATERNVKHAVGKWLKEEVTEEDLALVVFYGYETFEGRDGYWAMSDADSDDLFATTLHQDDLVEMFGRVQAKHLLLFVDSRPMKPSDTSPDSQQALCRQIVEEADHTVLIKASAANLMKGLQGEADANRDAVTDAQELWNYLNAQPGETELYGQIPAELPLTFNVALLQQQQEEQLLQARQDRLVEIYRSGDISAEQFKKAFTTLKEGKKDQILEDFLDGKISLELFQQTF